MRTNKLSLESKTKAQIPVDHPVVSWLAGYASWMCSTMGVGDDGVTPCQRVWGRPHTKLFVLFGETVLALGDTKGQQAQERGTLDARCDLRAVIGRWEAERAARRGGAVAAS